MIRYRSSSQRNLLLTGNVLNLSDDGFIRLSFDEFQGLSLIHLISGLDEDMPADIGGGAVVTAITGYTEWVTATSPAITIGWDWQMDIAPNRIQLRRISAPRSNVMLQDSGREDVGPTKTAVLLEMCIDALDWQSQVQKYIGMNFGR